MNRHGTRTLAMGLALAAMWPAALDARAYAPEAASVEAAVATFQEDAEERVYREARRAITREQFDRAIELFSRMRTDFPQGRYAPESYYWQAFSLYRLEGYREALSLLEAQLATYPEARINDDARELELRLRGQLARRGDAQSAAIALRSVEAALAQSAIATQQAMTGSQAEIERALARSAVASERSRRDVARTLASRESSSRQQQACPDNDVQEAALQALLQIDTDRALPILRNVLQKRDECSVPLRKQAIFVLSQHDVEDAEDLMIDVARNDPDDEVKESAVFWLSQVGTERALDALIDILESSADADLHENAIYAVSQHRSARAGELLRSIALDRSKSSRVREQAIFWLSQHRDNASADFLIELYGQLDSEDLKENVFFSLSQLNDPRAVDWMLERALDDAESIELRKQALFWAGQQRSVDLARLDGLYGRLRDREMKEQLIFLYSQRSEPEAVEALIRIAREEEDRELRKNAIFWLGQTNDERAIEFLLEIIGDPDGGQ